MPVLGLFPRPSEMADATLSPSKRQRLSASSPQSRRAAAAQAEPPAAPPSFATQPNGRQLVVGARSRGQLLTGVPAPQQDPPKRKASTDRPALPPLSSVSTDEPPVPKGTSNAERDEQQELNRGVPLPDEYRRLQESFLAVDTTISFFRARGEPCFFQPLHRTVQINTQNEFSARTLRLLLGVWPEAFTVEGAHVVATKARPVVSTSSLTRNMWPTG